MLPGDVLLQLLAHVKHSEPLREDNVRPFLLPNLPVLDLAGTCVTEALFQSGTSDFSGLEELRLAGAEWLSDYDSIVQRVLRSATMLHTLDLSGCQSVTDGTVKVLSLSYSLSLSMSLTYTHTLSLTL